LRSRDVPPGSCRGDRFPGGRDDVVVVKGVKAGLPDIWVSKFARKLVMVAVDLSALVDLWWRI